MIRQKFYKKMPNVQTFTFEDKVYVYVYLNETEGNTEPTEMCPSEHYYEYDYNEFCELTSNIDLNDLKNNPENYLDYEPVPTLSPAEKIQAQVLYTAMMTDTILEDQKNGTFRII